MQLMFSSALPHMWRLRALVCHVYPLRALVDHVYPLRALVCDRHDTRQLLSHFKPAKHHYNIRCMCGCDLILGGELDVVTDGHAAYQCSNRQACETRHVVV